MIPDPCTDPCKPKKPCGCIPNQFDHCIIVSEDLECIDVERGSKLKKALKAIDEYLCKLKEDINKAGSFIIRNVGGGAELFKGISLTGRRDFRTLKSEDKSVKIEEEEEEINFETPEIETNTPYIQVTRENGVDKVSFSGVGEVISTDGTVNIAVTGGNQYDLTGVQSLPGDTPYIGDNGNWWVGDTDTQVQAQGNQGEDGHTPYIDSNTGTWWINGEDTGYTAIGTNGITPHIGNNDNWWIGATDTGYPATGPQGESGIDGDTPHIGSNGNWYIGDVDTTIPATGPQGNPVTVTSEDSTVTVNSQEGGAIVDLSVNIPDSMTIEEANCEGGQTLVEVNGDTAKALCLVSDTVSITREGDSIRIESAPPELGGVPALIVNNNYTGVEEGTLVRPFRTLQNALDAYRGNGTRLNPELRGATIVLQSSNSSYPLNTNINYRDIKLVLEDNTQIRYNGTDWFLDMDSTSLSTPSGDVKNKVNITMSNSSTINIVSGSGIRNRGSDGGTDESHMIDIGGGILTLTGIHNQNRVLIDINGDNEVGYSQPTQTHLSTSGTILRSLQNKIIKIGLNSAVRINGGMVSSSTVGTDITNPELKAIEVVGGSITLTNTELQPLGNLPGGVARDYFIYMDDDNSGRVRLENCTVLYPKPTESFIYNAGGHTNSAEVIGLTMTRGNYVIKLIDSTNDWGGADVEFSQLNVEELNGALVDMTKSNSNGSINKVGNGINAVLPQYASRQDASQTLNKGDLFINTADNSTNENWYLDIVL